MNNSAHANKYLSKSRSVEQKQARTVPDVANQLGINPSAFLFERPGPQSCSWMYLTPSKRDVSNRITGHQNTKPYYKHTNNNANLRTSSKKLPAILKAAQKASEKRPIDYYDGLASKQKNAFITTMSKNMVRERNEKYACVDQEQGSKDQQEINELSEIDRTKIMNYETTRYMDYQRNDDFDSRTGMQDKDDHENHSDDPDSSEKARNFNSGAGIPPFADDKSARHPSPQSLTASTYSIPDLTRTNQEIVPLPNQPVVPEIKHELSDEADDYAIHLTNDLTGRNSENGGDTQKTQKFKSLWSLCEQEIAAQAELDASKKRIAELDHMLHQEQETYKSLEQKVYLISEKKKFLIEGK